MSHMAINRLSPCTCMALYALSGILDGSTCKLHAHSLHTYCFADFLTRYLLSLIGASPNPFVTRAKVSR